MTYHLVSYHSLPVVNIFLRGAYPPRPPCASFECSFNYMLSLFSHSRDWFLHNPYLLWDCSSEMCPWLPSWCLSRAWDCNSFLGSGRAAPLWDRIERAILMQISNMFLLPTHPPTALPSSQVSPISQAFWGLAVSTAAFCCLLSQQPLVLLLHLYNSVLPSAPCSYTLLLF